MEEVENLQQNENLIIKPADNIVLMNKKDYIEMVQRILSDQSTYKKLERVQTRMWLSNLTVDFHRSSHCKACDYMSTVKEFINPTDGRKYQIRQFFNCSMERVIYVAKCPCPRIYIGKTIRQVRRRILQHISSIRAGQDTLISRHMRFFHNKEKFRIQFWGI